MPADQEFLVSYGVKIDEAGVSRLQQILEQDRVLADRISGAFSGADESMQAFFRRAAETHVPAGEDALLSRLAKQYYGLSRLNRTGEDAETGGGYRAEGVRGQVQDLFSGTLTDSPDSGLMNFILRGQEITWAGMASGDTRNYVAGNSAGRPTLADFGITGDGPAWIAEYREKANEIMREPLQEARKIMKEAAEAEARGEDTRPYLERVEKILKEPLEKVRELYRTIDFEDMDRTGMDWEDQLAEIDKKWDALLEKMTEPIPLDLNTSAAESAARSAAEAIRSLFSSPVYLNVQPGSPGSGGPGSTFLRMSSGGRFTKPTQVQVAEDGDAEYIIPVKKEGKAVPLLRQLLLELSPAARESLGGETLTLQNADLAGMRAGSPAAAVTQNNQNISAPVNIHVNAHGADGKEIGETIYDTAERYMLRTLRGAGN